MHIYIYVNSLVIEQMVQITKIYQHPKIRVCFSVKTLLAFLLPELCLGAGGASLLYLLFRLLPFSFFFPPSPYHDVNFLSCLFLSFKC